MCRASSAIVESSASTGIVKSQGRRLSNYLAVPKGRVGSSLLYQTKVCASAEKVFRTSIQDSRDRAPP